MAVENRYLLTVCMCLSACLSVLHIPLSLSSLFLPYCLFLACPSAVPLDEMMSVLRRVHIS